MSVLKTLTENIVKRNLQRDGTALLNKWEKTGLLEGLNDDYKRNSLAVLLENQAKELLREATTMGAGDVEGYAAVAFPIVRRVFGGLIANDLVSVQPMSLPSGLVFFLDFAKQAPEANPSGVAFETRDEAGRRADGVGDSIYGGGQIGSGIMDGLDPSVGGVYNLQQGHSASRAAVTVANTALVAAANQIDLSGALTEVQQRALGFDADLLSAGAGFVTIARIEIASDNAQTHSVLGVGGAATGNPIQSQANAFQRCMGYGNNAQGGTLARTTPRGGLTHLALTQASSASALGQTSLGQDGNMNTDSTIIRRLTRIVQENATGNSEPGITVAQAGSSAVGRRYLEVVVHSATTQGNFGATTDTAAAELAVEFAKMDNLAAGNELGTLQGAPAWEMEDSTDLPEIDIQVDSAAITAATRKLKARWTPELAQDLNAYHNLDAEVELTGVLSEHIALEIDQEILGDLIKGATADTFFWSRRPGLFVNRTTGADITSAAAPPDFTGTVSEWYETLIETVNDVSASIHRKTLRGGANFLVCGPEVANILEFTSGFRASVTHDDDKGSVGAVSAGSINKKWDLIVDPYFPRNVILVGRKGGSFLESGYVYAPYVPLQVTPTIFDPDNFTPRKAVMTRYGKRMVNPDMYGLVLVRDLQG
jgi:hypothetical protein